MNDDLFRTVFDETDVVVIEGVILFAPRKEVIDALKEERITLERQLTEQESDLQSARRRSADLGIGDGSGAVKLLLREG